MVENEELKNKRLQLMQALDDFAVVLSRQSLSYDEVKTIIHRIDLPLEFSSYLATKVDFFNPVMGMKIKKINAEGIPMHFELDDNVVYGGR